MSEQVGTLQQLLDLHEIDQQVLAIERELGRYREELTGMSDSVSGLETGLERVEGELERAGNDLRRSERAVDERRDTLDRIRTRVGQVQNERQYSAASLEFDLVVQDIRKLEDRVLEHMQVVEELENRRNDILTQLEAARSEAGPRGVEITNRAKQLEDDLVIKRDRRHNLSIRIDSSALGLYDRIRAGRSQVGLAQLTEEAVCGYCFTSVTIQQEQQIKSMKSLICCEGCGVILYPGDFSA
jgi:predicted  nucleic acid-binding Zn-ribbon protein